MMDASLPTSIAGVVGLLVEGEAHAEAELGVVLEERVDQAGPRPSRLVVYGVVGRLPP